MSVGEGRDDEVMTTGSTNAWHFTSPRGTHSESDGRDDEVMPTGSTNAWHYFTSPRGTHYFFPRVQSSPELEVEQTLTIDTSTQASGFPPDHQHCDNHPPPPPLPPQSDVYILPSQVSLDDFSCHAPFSASYPPDEQFGYYHRSSWPGTNDSLSLTSQQQQQQQHFYYPPPNSAIGRPRPASSEQYGPRRKYGDIQHGGMYGSHQLNVYNIENERLFSALTFVRMNPRATLFDIDGKSFETV